MASLIPDKSALRKYGQRAAKMTRWHLITSSARPPSSSSSPLALVNIEFLTTTCVQIQDCCDLLSDFFKHFRVGEDTFEMYLRYTRGCIFCIFQILRYRHH